MSLAGKPAEFYVLPDTKLRGQANVVSVTSERGPFPGPVVPSENNLGLMFPIQSGELAPGAEGIRYVVSRAGGIGTGEYGWRKASDATDQFRGWDDSRRTWGHHAPFKTSVGSDNCASVFSLAFRRLIVCNADDATSPTPVLIRYRDIDDDRYDQWTETSFNLTNAVANGQHNIRMCDLPDGSLLLAVRTTVDGDDDIDIYRSDDGGLTWRLASEAIVGAFTNIAPAFLMSSQFQMARAGEHIRIAWMTTGFLVRTMVSTDRGISWEKTPNPSPDTVHHDTGATDDPVPFTIIPVDDSGTFILFALAIAGALNGYIGTGTGAWDVRIGPPDQNLPLPSQNILAVAGVRTPTYLWLYVYWAQAGANTNQGWQILRCFPNGFLDYNNSTDIGWQSVAEAQRYDTGIKYAPGRLTAVWVGERVFLYGSRRDKGSTYTDVNFPNAWYHGGWTRRSLWRARPTRNLSSFVGDLYGRFWTVEAGYPTEPSGSPWTTTGTGTFTATMDVLQMDSTAGNPIRFVRTIAAAAGPAWGQDKEACFGWVAKTDAGDGSLTADEAAVRIISQDLANTTTLDVSVRMAPGGLRVYDNNAATALDTIGTIAFDTGAGKFFEVRFAMWVGSGGAFKAQAAVLDTATGIWTVGAEVTLTSAAGAGSNILRFGGLDAPGAGTTTSHWRELWVCEGTSAHQKNFVNPTSLVGHPLSGTPAVYVADGMMVSWGGLGGALADVFDGDVAHAHPAGQVAVDSPRLDWRSSGQASQTLILDADPENGVGRWVHNAIALFGCNDRNVLVDYDNDVAFGSPTTTETVDFTAFGTGSAPLLAVLASGVTLLVTVPGATTFGAGELVGCYARVTTGPATGATWKITRHDQLATLAFDEETVDLVTQGIAVGNQIVIFAPNAALPFANGLVNQRYMRLRFQDADTAEGFHRCGTVVAGVKRAVDVPLDWARTDNQQPNVSQFRSRGAVTWSYEEGPPQRTWSGRLVGDAVREREQLRALIGVIGFETRPIAWVFDDERPVEQVALVRWTGGSQLDNAGFYRDTNDVIRAAGDLTITLVEEV